VLSLLRIHLFVSGSHALLQPQSRSIHPGSEKAAGVVPKLAPLMSTRSPTVYVRVADSSNSSTSPLRRAIKACCKASQANPFGCRQAVVWLMLRCTTGRLSTRSTPVSHERSLVSAFSQLLHHRFTVLMIHRMEGKEGPSDLTGTATCHGMTMADRSNSGLSSSVSSLLSADDHK
jgi:hypothetical protein